MRRHAVAVLAILVLPVIASVPAFGQGRPAKGNIIIPQSSIEAPGDLGKRAHTNIRIFVPADGGGQSGALYYETPASLACVYRLVKPSGGCNPNLIFTNATGGGKAIAIVDAFDTPNAVFDLGYFSSYYNLPAPNFQITYATGMQPPAADFGWNLEADLDIEWAHAMAPNAKIYLVEAASNSLSDLFSAVKVASKLVAAAGGGEVSMSWSTSEWAGETAYDSLFTTAGVVYFAAAGDTAGTAYPSVSPNIVAAGGTTLRRDAVSGNLLAQEAWVNGGGGKSIYEARPSYQAGISSLVGSSRGVPDLASDAEPYTGLWVYNTYDPLAQWWIVGGTSAASPVLAGIVNLAGNFVSSTNAELTAIYNNMSTTADFKDITQGFCGFYMGDAAVKGWDFCTGVGSPIGLQGK